MVDNLFIAEILIFGAWMLKRYFGEPIIWCLWTTSKIFVTENVVTNPAFSDTDHLSIKLKK